MNWSVDVAVAFICDVFIGELDVEAARRCVFGLQELTMGSAICPDELNA